MTLSQELVLQAIPLFKALGRIPLSAFDDVIKDSIENNDDPDLRESFQSMRDIVVEIRAQNEKTLIATKNYLNDHCPL